MMKYFCSVIVLLSLLSCNKKYEGNWTSDFLKVTSDSPKNVNFKEDSIIFNYWAYNQYHKYPFKIKKDELWFNGWRVKVNLLNDTLSLNNTNFYIKDVNDSILKEWFGDPILEISLPKIQKIISGTIDSNSSNYYIFFGKRTDNENYSLQLNDRYAEIKDLPSFIVGERASHRHELINFSTAVLFFDENTPLKHLEDIFYNLKNVNQLKVNLINNINLKFNDSLGVYYEYESLSKRLPPMFESDNYSPNYSSEQIPPPYPFPPLFEDDSSDISYFILKDNSFFHNKIRAYDSELSLLAEKAINKNNIIFSLYDLNSNYESFLKMNAIIDGVYNKKRNELALKKFNKNLSELDVEQASEIKLEIRMKHIWSYSIPHFQHITNNDNSFLGLKAKPIDSLLPN